jgi:hypothetical protein
MLQHLPKDLRTRLSTRIAQGKAQGTGTASANILGKNYVKQVDVVISAWHTGPELLISTKRMDSSFGKNAANRIEESYGDAKNLRLRYPQAGHGFLYGLRSTAFIKEPAKAEWILDLLIKMGQEDDAYDAVGLLVPEWAPKPGEPESPDEADNAGSEADTQEEAAADAAVPDVPDDVVETQLAQLRPVVLRTDRVPAELDPARFLSLLVTKVLRNSPIDFHVEARRRRQAMLGEVGPGLTRGL